MSRAITHVLHDVSCVRQEGVAPEWRFVSKDGHACILSLDDRGTLRVDRTSERIWDASKSLAACIAPHDDWAKCIFDIKAAPGNYGHEEASKWNRGIHVDVGRCKAWGMSEEWAGVFEKGVDLMLDQWPVTHEHLDNYSSATCDEARGIAQGMLNTQVDSGFIEITHDVPRVTHPLGMIKKTLDTGKIKWRLVVDARASKINSCMRQHDFTLPTLESVVAQARLNWFMAKYDLQDGFLHIKVSDNLVDYLGIKFPDSSDVGRFRFLCFGLKCAPVIFQGAMCHLRAMLLARQLNAAVLVYIDDWLLMAPTREALEEAMAVFEHAMGDMKFKLHPDKREGPIQIMEYIGYVIDLVAAAVSISVARQSKLTTTVQDTIAQLEADYWSFDEIESTAGKLAHASKVLEGGAAALLPLYEILKRTGAMWDDHRPPRRGFMGSSKVGIPTIGTQIIKEAVKGLQFWEARLLAPQPPKKRVFVFKDESMAVWGPALIVHKNERFLFTAVARVMQSGCHRFRRLIYRIRILRRRSMDQTKSVRGVCRHMDAKAGSANK